MDGERRRKGRARRKVEGRILVRDVVALLDSQGTKTVEVRSGRIGRSAERGRRKAVQVPV